jgi:hypothetical protein
MLQGLADDYLAPCVSLHGEAPIRRFLAECGDHGGRAGGGGAGGGGLAQVSLLELPALLRGCRVVKHKGRMYKAKEEDEEDEDDNDAERNATDEKPWRAKL